VTARVFVPLVDANGEGAQLFEAIADESAPSAAGGSLSARARQGANPRRGRARARRGGRAARLDRARDRRGARRPPACSWQVWVSDPAFPSPGAAPLAVPLAPNDRLPVGAAATFRVGHSGLLQSRLYAFDETRPGAIRDLAAVAEVDIPVAAVPEGETIVLATARRSAPFLERLKSALAAADGERRDLGKDFALGDKLVGPGRGIGANILAILPDMVAPKRPAMANVGAKPRPEDGALMETYLYALTPAP
jgi:hypothetical protein